MNGQELKLKIKALGLSQKDVAIALGITPQSVNAILTSKDLRTSTIERFAEVCKKPISYFCEDVNDTTIPANSIPLIPIEAMAGVFTDNNSVGITPEMCEYYTVPSFKGADFLITVKGDSMVPRYFGGDIVACKKLSLNDLFFQWGKVYVLDTEQGALVKKVQKGSNDDSLTLVSENADYAPFEIPKKAIYHIALVIGTIRVE